MTAATVVDETVMWCGSIPYRVDLAACRRELEGWPGAGDRERMANVAEAAGVEAKMVFHFFEGRRTGRTATLKVVSALFQRTRGGGPPRAIGGWVLRRPPCQPGDCGAVVLGLALDRTR